MRYLFNAITDPRKATRILPFLLKFGRIEKNPGDMAYERAVMNTLATDSNVDFLLTGYYYARNGFPPRLAAEANETCKAFVCPLADAFNSDWIWFVRNLTDLVKRLGIPCVVPCVGARSEDANENAELAGAVRAFVSAVLDKSACIGVRGETTARFVEKLGFVRGRHFEVLGCPSLYTYGEKLEVRPFAGFGSCAFTMNHRADAAGWSFIDRCAALFRASTYVSQNDTEFYHFMLSDGGWFRGRNILRDEFQAKYAAENRMRFFLNHRPWLDFLSGMDLTVGHRIHGALLSVLAGTPAAVVPFESRTEELARFHGVPLLLPIEGESEAGLRRRIEALDFSQLAVRQTDNFRRYVEFLHRNGLKTVFDAGTPALADFPLERAAPASFPDDDIRAWRFNPAPFRRISAAAILAKGAQRRLSARIRACRGKAR
jgi:hypothetical protein